MKRKYTLIGFIIGLLANLVLGGVLSFVSFLIVAIVSDLGGDIIGFTPLICLVVLSVIATIFNAIAISVWKKEHTQYVKNIWKIITAIIFNFIIIGIAISTFFVQDTNNLLSILLIIFLLISNTFAILDMVLEKSKVNKNDEEIGKDSFN